MTLPKTLYEILKFLATFISGVTAIISALLLAFGAGEHTTNIVVLCVASLGQIIVLFVNTAAKNHWKAVAEDGTTEDIEEIETNNDSSQVTENTTEPLADDYDDELEG